MNRSQIVGILIRHSISAAGAVLAANGMLSSEQASQADSAAETISGVILVLVSLALSAHQKAKAAKAIAK